MVIKIISEENCEQSNHQLFFDTHASKNNIVLFSINETDNFPLKNVGPFCLKLECIFKMNRVPYKLEPITFFTKLPKSKVPLVKVKSEGSDFVISDSHIITKRLASTGILSRDFAKNDPIRYVVEDHLYFLLVYIRYKTFGYKSYFRDLFPFYTPIFKFIGLHTLKLRILFALNMSGFGRFTMDEVVSMIKEDYQILDEALGDKAYFGGDSPMYVDACVFGVLSNAFFYDGNTIMGTLMFSFERLIQYLMRFVKLIFPEYYFQCKEYASKLYAIHFLKK